MSPPSPASGLAGWVSGRGDEGVGVSSLGLREELLEAVERMLRVTRLGFGV